ncbi:hypothetical protein RHSIM_Rhsim09G0194600 [Rhododendron simsii]|uniref:3-ketoacyl-CoA synthase n=1 Tax=Rhododendron simsii TaxID=118357 RepID=A0A834GDB4_RHOSS|nr:hypothetical protein RHSIM_Rhsim09G0194600 [Rhododendron simsii]
MPNTTFLTKKLHSSLLDLLNFSVEAFLIIQKWHMLFHALWLLCFLLFFFLKYHYFSKPLPVYLVDFSCLKPPSSCRVPFSTFIQHAQEFFDEQSISFMAKVLCSSGQGQQTYLPPALHYIPPRSNHHESTKEVEMVLFPVLEDLLSKTNLSPQEIDILIVNCSGFCPIPSLSSIIVNKYSMRDDIRTFTLSGMGCSASALAINMAQNLLKVHKDSNAVVLSTEILSTGWYPGKEKSMLALNCLFRMGSSGILLSNKKDARNKAKYKLVHSLRSQRASDDKGYYSAFREEDSDGITGFTLRRDLLQVAGETLRSNITAISPSVLPAMEIFRHLASKIWKRLIDKSVETYLPNFRSVIQHFCLPASGRPVIREIGKGLRLGEGEMEPALVTLHRFGNQSSSSLWYELAYLEAKERVKKGDKVWQLGMGSGPKCTSLVWKCVRPIVGEAQKGPWDDCIDSYPNLVVEKD